MKNTVVCLLFFYIHRLSFHMAELLEAFWMLTERKHLNWLSLSALQSDFTYVNHSSYKYGTKIRHGKTLSVFLLLLLFRNVISNGSPQLLFFATVCNVWLWLIPCLSSAICKRLYLLAIYFQDVHAMSTKLIFLSIS